MPRPDRQRALPNEVRLPLLVYNVFFPLLLLGFLPGYLLKMFRRGNYRRDFGQRFGRYSKNFRERIQHRDRIWIHAVSVGEVLIALKLIAKLRELQSGRLFILSTTTTTAFSLAKKSEDGSLFVIYNPLDFPLCIRNALNVLRPSQIVLVEAEVWPNLTSQAAHRGISVSLVNARLSPRSEKRFRAFRFFTGPFFRLLDLVCVQEAGDVERWVSLGIDPARIERTGSIKFDEPTPNSARFREFAAILQLLGTSADAPILLAGSTHPGEEKILLSFLRELRTQFPTLLLVVAPRHVERTAEIEAIAASHDLKSVRRTQVASASSADVLIIDTTGELRDWYPLATVIFVGKSLTSTGGQNPVEAIAAGKPVIFGPHMENFDAISKLLLFHKAAVQVQTGAELKGQIQQLLANPARRDELIRNSTAALTLHAGATARTAQLLNR
ncbi:MAG: 3-deoxy-D-manno-octulosonic acid transferase [Verrucomicrobiota bacterium]|nr:3-deoxy-D-manno-octulosonic acid transferase [Verrucomicrobiota bacterium]